MAADHELKHKAATSQVGDVVIIPVSTMIGMGPQKNPACKQD